MIRRSYYISPEGDHLFGVFAEMVSAPKMYLVGVILEDVARFALWYLANRPGGEAGASVAEIIKALFEHGGIVPEAEAVEPLEGDEENLAEKGE